MSGTLSFPPRADVLRKLRADVRDLTQRLGGDEGIGDVVALVADELVNNAIEHGAGYRLRNLDLELSIAYRDARWFVTFRDPEMPQAEVAELAVAMAEVARGMPSLESERGRGLFLLSVYLERIAVCADAMGGLRLEGWVAKS
ncbi:MAG: Histidine kinaselike ATPase domain [Planctomycetota bacterium]